jgi:hypothetical protein
MVSTSFTFIFALLLVIPLSSQAQQSAIVEVISGGKIEADATIVMDDCPAPVVLARHEEEKVEIDEAVPVIANTMAQVNEGGCNAEVHSSVNFDPVDFTLTATSTLEIISESTSSAVASFPEATINFNAPVSMTAKLNAETVVDFSPQGFSQVVISIRQQSNSTEILRVIWNGTASHSVPFNLLAGENYVLDLDTNFTEHAPGTVHSFVLSFNISESEAPDNDQDGIADIIDNCPNVPNPMQEDNDHDFIGDACDPFPNEPDHEKAQCLVDLDSCLENPPFLDEDGDGEADLTDLCPYTPQAAQVDANGCSLSQYCSAIDANTPEGRKICERSDWKNDEPLENKGNCEAVKEDTDSLSYLCVPR